MLVEDYFNACVVVVNYEVAGLDLCLRKRFCQNRFELQPSFVALDEAIFLFDYLQLKKIIMNLFFFERFSIKFYLERTSCPQQHAMPLHGKRLKPLVGPFSG
jgi:hypothetical protein